MFVNSKKVFASANRLAAFRNINYGKKLIDSKTSGKEQLHTASLRPIYTATATLPIPNNIDVSESTHFSPQRARDITANVIISQQAEISNWRPTIDITADNSVISKASATSQYTRTYDPHVQSYDCFGAVSLSAVMQSNVPEPYGGMHKFTHLNMPGGQFAQEMKFTSENLNSSHYQELRNKARESWASYDQNASVNQKEYLHVASQTTNINNKTAIGTSTTVLSRLQDSTMILPTTLNRSYCSKAEPKQIPKEELSKKERLKRAFKEYGATIIVFHVALSLASLGGFYGLVSGGIDMMPVLEYLGLTSTALSNKIATGASTFVVAYAVHKVFAPVRISITLGATPFIVRYLRSKGFLKPKIVNPK